MACPGGPRQHGATHLDIHDPQPVAGTAHRHEQVAQALAESARRVEFVMMTPVGNYWRHAHPFTAALLTQFKDFGESNKDAYANAQRWLNRELDGKAFLAGDVFTMADICALSTVDFATWIGLPLDPAHSHLGAWHERVSSRPSAGA